MNPKPANEKDYFKSMRFPFWLNKTDPDEYFLQPDEYLPENLQAYLIDMVTQIMAGNSYELCSVHFKADFFQVTIVKGFYTAWRVGKVQTADQQVVYEDDLSLSVTEPSVLPKMKTLHSAVAVRSLEVHMQWQPGQISSFFEFIGCETGNTCMQNWHMGKFKRFF